MKKYISVVLAVIIAFSVAVFASAKTVYKGDVDGDGKVSSVDARYALQAIAELKTLTAEEKRRADYDGDGKISTIDVRRILQTVAETLPLEELPNVQVGDGVPDGEIDWDDIKPVP